MKPETSKNNNAILFTERFLKSKLTSPKIIISALFISIISFFILSCSNEKSSGNN